jgi:F-type H+-transporting ATPase subunit delta
VKPAARPVARRYSRALLDLTKRPSRDKGETLPLPAALAAELQASVELLEKAPELARALADPLLPVARKKALVEAVWARSQASPLVMRLVGLLVDQGRMDLLPAVEEAFRHAWNAERGVVEAEASSAVELDVTQKTTLTKALALVSGKDVDLEWRLDPKLIGGMLVKMAGKSYDGSVRGRLKALRSRLVYGA